MTTMVDELVHVLERALRGEAAIDELWALLESARQRSPAAITEFRQHIDALYGRNEIRYDAYLTIKDRLSALQRPSANTAPGAQATRPPAMTRPPEQARGAGTVLRPSATAAPVEDVSGRTVLRSVTPPAATGTISRPGATAAAPVATGPSTGPRWDDATSTVTTEQPLEPGSLIKGRFLLEERVGSGGMGVVFKARDVRKEEAQDRDPYVAIKFLNPSFRTHPESLKALQRETRRAQTLAHPNVVTVYDFDRDGTLIYMTMEFLAGEPLDLFIQRHPQGIRFGEAWPLIEGAGRALMYAHEQGVIHADFKPGNVFVVENKAKVLDFGIARAMKTQSANQQGTRFDAGSLGALTPAYASPEMLLNEEPDPRDDVYALACVAYELMTGRHPFGGTTAVRAAHDGMKVKRTPGMGRYQYKALLHGLAFRQADRTPTIERFLDEIAGPFGVRGRAVRQALLSTAGTAIVVSAAAVAIWFYTRPDPDKQLERRLVEAATAQVEQGQKAGQPVETFDPELSKVLLEQGNDYLDSARKHFDPGMLSEGVSNAYGAFQEVLRMDPKNHAAVAGIVSIVKLYEAEIQRRMEAQDYAGVVELAGYARKIDPNRATLEDLEREARTHLAAPAPAAK